MAYGVGPYGAGPYGVGAGTAILGPDDVFGPPPLLDGSLWERAAAQGGVKTVHEVTVTVPGGEPVVLIVASKNAGGMLETKQSLDRGSRWSAELSIIRPPRENVEELVTTPGAVFRIRYGFHFGGRVFVWANAGVYELAKAPSVSRGSLLQLSLLDQWQKLEQMRLLSPRSFSTGGRIRIAISMLVRDAMPDVKIIQRGTDNPLLDESLPIERSRTDGINDLAAAGNLSAYFNRDGDFVIGPVSENEAASAAFTDGQRATILDLSHEEIYTRLYNAIRVIPNGEATFAPHTVNIANADSPLHRSKIGVRPAFWATEIPSGTARINGARKRLEALVGRRSKFSVNTFARGDLDVGSWVTALQAPTWAEQMRSYRGVIDEIVYDALSAETKITARSQANLDVEDELD